MALPIIADPTPTLSPEQTQTGLLRVPCSPAQQRFWLQEQLDPGSPALNIAVRWRLEGEAEIDLLEAAWRAIIARHQPLRTWFDPNGGEPMQCIEPAVDFCIPLIDLTDLSAEAASEEAERIARFEARATFSLAAVPLIRVTCLRLQPRVSILLVTAHHLVCDGWSIGCLAEEMGEICAALHEDRAPDLPSLPVTYGDYASWQNHLLATVSLAGEQAFWCRYLDGARYFTFPTSSARRPVQSSGSDIASILLDRKLTEDLASLARHNGATMFMAALSALLVLLHRHTGETDISIGTQVTGRHELELERLVGVFINTVILRNDLSGNPLFLGLLGRVQQSVGDVLEHQEVPAQRVNVLFNSARDADARGISVNFIFQRSFIRNATYGGFALIDLPSFSAGALYDLNFFMVERPEGWRISCEFSTDQFEASVVIGLLERLRNIFSAVAEQPMQPISRIPMLGPAERRRLISDINATTAPCPDLTLPQLFERQARRSPEAIAVICQDRKMRYGELEALANRFAALLRRHGCGARDRVGVFLDRSPELVAGLLAVLKTGAAYVPLDPSYPRGRIADIAGSADLAVMLTTKALTARLPGLGTDLILIDEAEGGLAEPSASSSPSPDDLAYVIYTSGSAGRPKGVQIPHRALVNLLMAMAERPGLQPDDTLLAVTTVAFDIAGLEIFLPLMVGARLVMAREQEVADGQALCRLLSRHGVTVLQATPATWRLLIESGWYGDGRLKMLCGGESLPRKLASELIARGGELWNMYGPTETTIWSAAARIDASEDPIPLGTPIANTQFYILDCEGELAPPGAIGELHIGGDGVAAGYLGLPEITAERFIADKFSARPGARLYRTGDSVRLLPSGKFAFIGRKDQQIKLRGYRIELGEIEAALQRDAQISEAAAIAGQAPSGETEIWAYIVQKDGAANSDAALREAARSALNWHLPAYMQPAAIVVMRSLPRTSNGKIDKSALQPPEPDQAPVPASPPVGDTERRIADIWSALLGRPVVSAAADFFDAGGNSLLAARLLLRIEASFGRRIGLASLFKARTIQGLARLLETDTGRDLDFRQIVKLRPNSRKLPIVAVNNTGIFSDLVNRFLLDRPFTALQVLDPTRSNLGSGQSFEELAAEYVQLLLRLHPDRPSVLMGWCVGAALAFEAAQQLRRQGHEIPLLILIDGWVPGYLRRLPRPAAMLADYSYRSQLIMSDWKAYSSGEHRLSNFLSGRNLSRRVGLSFGPGGPAGKTDFEDPVSAESFDQRLQRYLDALARHYDPEPYAGRILLLRCTRQPKPVFLDPSLGWAPYAAGGIEVIDIPGTHFTMFGDPGVQRIGEAISATLTEIEPSALSVTGSK